MVRAIDLELVFPYTEDCILLKSQIDRLVVNKQYWSEKFNNNELEATQKYLDSKKQLFNKNNCELKNLEQKFQYTNLVIENFSSQDKARIESETKRQIAEKQLFAIGILLIGLAIVVSLTKNKNEIK
jgi:hypothetical protein